MKKISIKVNTEHINAMLKALTDVGTFVIDADYEANTVVITHKVKGEVLKAIRASKEDLWLVSHNKDLFK